VLVPPRTGRLAVPIGEFPPELPRPTFGLAPFGAKGTVRMAKARELSEQLADAVATAEKSIVTIFGDRSHGASGLAWSKDVVVTAAHALEREDGLEVVVGDGRVKATLLGADAASDLAVLRVEETTLAPPATADPGALRLGELALALSRTARGLKVRLGVVSRLGGEWRLPGGQRVERFVESDIVPAPGHSGSVLVNADGALIGVNAAGFSRGSLVALPASAVAGIVDAIVQHGRVRRARLGVGLERVALPRVLAERRGQRRGLLVTSVLEGSPAERGGVVLGDLILGVEGRPTERVDDLMSVLGESAIGVPLAVDLVRAGTESKLTLSPEAR
jgi:S1-C subfamily serine protease